MRDKRGRFSKKEDEGIIVNFTLPSLKKIFYLILLFAIILPCLMIGSKFNILKKIFEFIDKLLIGPNEGNETEKNGLFY